MSNPTKTSSKRGFYNFFVDHWFISWMLASLPTGVSIFFTVFGGSFMFNEKGKLSLPFIILLIIFFIFSSAFISLKFYFERRESINKTSANQLYKNILDKDRDFNSLRTSEYINFHIQKGKSVKISCTPKLDINTRIGHIHIFERKSEILCSLLELAFGIEQSNIGISIIAKIKNKWIFILSNGLTNDLNLSEVTDNTETTFYKVSKMKTGQHIFYPDKNIACDKNEYLRTKKEEDCFKRKTPFFGSIYCSNISLEADSLTLLEAVFTVTTYGKQICLDNYFSRTKTENLFEFIEADLKHILAEYCLFDEMGFYS